MADSAVGRAKSRGILARLAVLAGLALAVAVLAGLAQILAGPGTRLGLWDYSFGFKLIEWAAYVGAGAAVVAVIGTICAGLARCRSLLIAGLIAIIVGAGIAYWPGPYRAAFRTAPRVYDVTTDTANPPAYVAALELRKGTRIPPEYAKNLAALQQKAYPDMKPVMLKLPPDDAFARALATARDMSGWEVHTAVPAEGRIEAVATTFWFGFQDDVVIRVAAIEGGSQVDVRSSSRIARVDGGANAKRVQAYLTKLTTGG